MLLTRSDTIAGLTRLIQAETQSRAQLAASQQNGQAKALLGVVERNLRVLRSARQLLAGN